MAILRPDCLLESRKILVANPLPHQFVDAFLVCFSERLDVVKLLRLILDVVFLVIVYFIYITISLYTYITIYLYHYLSISPYHYIIIYFRVTIII